MAEPDEVIIDRFPENDLERAIEAAMKDPARDRAEGRKPLWRALYASEVIVPLSTTGPDKEIALPEAQGETGLLTLELYGKPHAVIFSSASQMHLALPDGCSYARVMMRRLVGLWPEVPAALNPQGFGCTMSAEEVRGLPL
ncbi:MAG: SseB family protein, partial [Candidatus Dormibacteraeota bacterium]|nr:SseB family protein [Candidatus Dormibacteraeota bacterium]